MASDELLGLVRLAYARCGLTLSSDATKVLRTAPEVPAAPNPVDAPSAAPALAASAGCAAVGSGAVAAPAGGAAASPAATAVSGGAAAAEEREDPATHLKLLALLTQKGVAFTTLEHAPTRTSEESAAVRGVPLATGAKAMLLKASKPLPHGSPYLLAVLSAAHKADLGALRKALKQKSVSLASDVTAITGCLPGAVPPFGSLFPGVRTYLDPSLLEQERVNFNAGLRTFSVGMARADYLAIEQPEVLPFSTE